MNLLKLYRFENVTGIETTISTSMREKMSLWIDMYTGNAPWHTEAPSCGVEKTLAGNLSVAIGEEIKLVCKNETIDAVLQKLNSENYKITQMLVSLGGCVIRPIFAADKLQYEAIPLGNYLPTQYDFDGTLTSCVIVKSIANSKKTYLLIEKHKYENNTHTVETKLYENSGGSLRECPLTACVQTETLTPVYSWQNVDCPFIVEFRNRSINTIDGSNIPVAMIEGAEPLIRDADEQYNRINWEQEGGELKVFADDDLFSRRQGQKGNTEDVRLDSKLQKLFVKLHGDGSESGQKIITHSPALRTEQQVNAFQEILKRIEQKCNVGKGTLSDLENVQQTATQFTGGKKAFYSVVDAFESELEQKYRHCAYVFAYMASAYLGVPFDDDFEIEFNDMARKDPMQMKQIAMQEVSAGIMDKCEYRVQFYGETEAEAKAKVPTQETANPFGNF